MLIVSVAVIASFSIILFFLNFDPSGSNSYKYTVQSSRKIVPRGQPSLGLPVRLKIPTIHVDAPLESVGLAPDGSVDVPKSRVSAAWFNLGPRPGEKGSSVIDGHFGWWKDGTPAVFDNLGKLRKGDKLYIEDEKGATATFVVRAFRTFDQNEEAPSVFSSSDGKAHLNLITCEGTWDKVAKSYSQRLVVFTDKEIE